MGFGQVKLAWPMYADLVKSGGFLFEPYRCYSRLPGGFLSGGTVFARFAAFGTDRTEVFADFKSHRSLTLGVQNAPPGRRLR